MNDREVYGESAVRGATTDLRVLHRVDIPSGPTGRGLPEVAGFGVVIDVKTTGLDFDNDVVIELGARRFAHDANHEITRIDRPYSWRQDPHRPLSSQIREITGLTDADLAGREIDAAEAARVIGSTDVRIAHNAAFDRPFVEKLLPDAAGRSWACSIEDVGWSQRGYDSTKLEWILATCGFFHESRQAEAAVNATIQVLMHELEPGRTTLSLMMENAKTNSWIVRAFGAAFELKELLRSRRYRWNPVRKVWWKEVRDRTAEEAWLAENIYRGTAHAGVGLADIEPVDWTSRYAR